MILDFITWNASPTIFGHLRWYGLMFAIGFWIGTLIMTRMFEHERAPEKWIGILLIYTVLGTIIGARLGHVFFYEWPYYSTHLSEIPMVWRGGLASHGGVIGVVLAVVLFSIFTSKRSVLWTLDRLCVPTALVAGLIRLGNLFNSEIFGHQTDLPWGFIFVRAGMDVPCHPTQIYEALAYFALFALLMWMYWKKNAEERHGLLLGTFFVWVFSARFLIEFVKNIQDGPTDAAAYAATGLNMGQWLSIPCILIGIVLLIYAFSRPRQKIDFARPKKK